MGLEALFGPSGASTLGGIGSLLNAFGLGKPKVKYGPTPSEAQANSLFQALLDPNNSLVKQNTDINMQKGMQDMLMQLKLIQMQNARGQARGLRPAVFSPERADETINYLLTRGQPAIAEQARDKARSDILTSAKGLSGLAEREQLMQLVRNQDLSTSAANLQAHGGFGGLGNGLQDLLRKLMPTKQQPDFNPNAFGPYQPFPWQK